MYFTTPADNKENDAFKTPLQPAPKSKRQILMKTPEVLVPDDDESPIVRVKKRNTKLVMDEEEEDDDFQGNK